MNFADNYRAEANDLLADLEIALLELEQQPLCHELTDRVFRTLHTIKGSGAMFGFDKIAAFTHEVESTYDLVREEKLKVRPRLISLTLLARDHIKSLLDGAEAAEVERIGKQIIAGFLEFQKSTGVETRKIVDASPAIVDQECESKTYEIRFKPGQKIFTRGINLRLILSELQLLGEYSALCHTDGLPDLEDFEPETSYLHWTLQLTTDQGEGAIREAFVFVEEESELEIVALTAEKAILGEESAVSTSGDVSNEHKDDEHAPVPKSGAAKSEASSLRVATDKLDDLVNIVGEIVTMQARLTQVATICGDPEVSFVAEEMERLTDKLRDSTLSIRMLPIGATFGTYRRFVRDLAGELNKDVELVTEGGDTELDKTVIEKINDPIVHLIRNCIDHGLESPEDRAAVGKPKTGKITLAATHSGAHVIITISDDGAGLNKEAIRQKGIEKGLIKAGQELTERELFSLILSAGFSTAKAITGVSGRGVGMDVVKQNVEGLRGTLDINSKAGAGTTFTLRLPLTLAIIDGLLVKVGTQHFVLPLANILECIELSTEAIAKNRGREFVIVRDEMVPYVDIRKHFGISSPRPAILQVIIAETREGKMGFLVDLVIGDHKTVIKRLGGLYENVEAISGAAILGDGTIALILDLGELSNVAMELAVA